LTPQSPQQRGFSLVELIATLTVIGILAAFAIPRLVDRTSFEARGVYDQAQGAVRYAQKVAIAQRRSLPGAPVYVVISPSRLSVCYDAACTSPVADPGTGTAVFVAAPPGIAYSPVTSFSYSGSGAPSLAAPLAITVSSTAAGEADRFFYVEATTGYVHD
jgi:MSHA pilin protein MshC